MTIQGSSGKVTTRRARWAVSVVYFVHGATIASWAAEIPRVRTVLQLTDVRLGLALSGPGIGALLGSALGVRLVRRWGSRRAGTVAAVLLCVSLCLVTTATTSAMLMLCLLVLGAADAATDVGMNAQAVSLQQAYDRSILNGLHATRSAGAMAGALVASLMIAGGVPVRAQLDAVAACLAVPVLVAAPFLLPVGTTAALREAHVGRSGRGRLRSVGPLVLLAFLAAVVSDTPASWGGVYLKSLGASSAVAASAYGVYSAGEILGRLCGDRVVSGHGWSRLIMAGAVGAAVVTALALAVGRAPVALVAFGVTGLGVSVAFPGAFATAGSLPDVPAETAIGHVTFSGRLGWLALSPLVGGLATLFDLTAALLVLPVAALGIALLAPATNGARGGVREAQP